jgi:hypothetical protein
VARLRVERPYDGGGILRRLSVEVDGRRIAVLRQGRSADVELSPGRHTVVASMDWTSGAVLDVDLADGEEVRLEVALPLSAMWDMLWRPRRALSIRRIRS